MSAYQAYKTWRKERRDAVTWVKAHERADLLPERETIDHIDMALMMGGQALTRYRRAGDRPYQLDQLRELRLALEASLAMLDVVLEDS